jgi:hypothetical protein
VASEKAVRVLAPPETVLRAQSVLGGIDQAALLLGSLLGGVLLTLASWSAIAAVALLCSANLALVSVVPEGAAFTSAEALRSQPDRVPRLVAGSIRFVWQNPVLRLVVAETMVINLLAGLTIAATPAVLMGRFAMSAATASTAYVAAGLVSVLVVIVAPWLIATLGLTRTGAASAMLSCAAITGCFLAVSAPLFIGLTVVFLAVTEVFAVFIRVVRARVVPVGVFGSVSAVIVLLNFTTFPVAGLVLAAAAHWRLAPLTLYGGLGAAALVVTACLADRLVRRMPQQRVDGHWLVPSLDNAA